MNPLSVLLDSEIGRRMLHTPGSATFKKDTARRRQEYEEELRATGRRR